MDDIVAGQENLKKILVCQHCFVLLVGYSYGIPPRQHYIQEANRSKKLKGKFINLPLPLPSFVVGQNSRISDLEQYNLFETDAPVFFWPGEEKSGVMWVKGRGRQETPLFANTRKSQERYSQNTMMGLRLQKTSQPALQPTNPPTQPKFLFLGVKML